MCERRRTRACVHFCLCENNDKEEVPVVLYIVCVLLCYVQVFGESVLNDAVAIVMYRTINRFTKADVDFSAGNFLFAIFEFGYISVGSVAIGISSGLIFSLCTKHLRLKGDLPTLSIIMWVQWNGVLTYTRALHQYCLIHAVVSPSVSAHASKNRSSV